MTPERRALYDALICERYTPRRPPPEPVLCTRCGHITNRDEPCPECERRRIAKHRRHLRRTK